MFPLNNNRTTLLAPAAAPTKPPWFQRPSLNALKITKGKNNPNKRSIYIILYDTTTTNTSKPMKPRHFPEAHNQNPQEKTEERSNKKSIIQHESVRKSLSAVNHR